jgi:hypothetical protein
VQTTRAALRENRRPTAAAVASLERTDFINRFDLRSLRNNPCFTWRGSVRGAILRESQKRQLPLVKIGADYVHGLPGDFAA